MGQIVYPIGERRDNDGNIRCDILVDNIGCGGYHAVSATCALRDKKIHEKYKDSPIYSTVGYELAGLVEPTKKTKPLIDY